MKLSRVERLLGTEISASYLTDDVLGRTLDEIYKADSTHLFMKLALKMLEIVNIRTQLLQSETTNFIFHGDYKYIDDGSTIETTYGHAKDGRDGLKRFGLGMITNHSMEYHYLQRPTLIISDKETN
ncbi:Mobile element protein [Methanosarcina barkeri str. Wiesmoor]|uniref:Mobile element protein n=1 Tax=Methanosarcina barkeri str. Wiesmoor TaxID=1434109 RepID=A0A0E3LL85_METBA|nr:Mobile element protein [Methanosarcina barkeri str. Wiesmoor]